MHGVGLAPIVVVALRALSGAAPDVGGRAAAGRGARCDEIGLQPADVLTRLDPLAGLPSASKPLDFEVAFGSDAGMLPATLPLQGQLVAGPPAPAEVEYTIAGVQAAPPEAGQVSGVMETQTVATVPAIPR